jgi:hypothetical protein
MRRLFLSCDRIAPALAVALCLAVLTGMTAIAYAVFRLPAVPASASASSSAAGAGAGSAPTQPVPPRPAPDGSARPQAAATPQALLEHLVRLLPPGRTSEYAGHTGATVEAELRYDVTGLAGRIRVVLGPDLSTRQLADRACSKPPVIHECRILSNGDVAHLWVGRNCIQNAVSSVDQRDGTHVRIEFGSCLVPQDLPRSKKELQVRRRPPPNPVALDVGQLIAADPGWGRRMDAEIVRAGARNFPTLSAITDPDRPLIPIPPHDGTPIRGA